MLAKGVIKDVARVLGFPFEDSNALTDLIPDQLKITLKEAFEQEPKFAELIANNPKIAKLFDLAKRLEGVTRHASKHAAGIVIFPKLFAKIESFLSEHTVFVIKGNVENTPQGIKIKAQSIIPIDLIFQQGTCAKITFQLPDTLNKELLNTLKDTWKPGAIPVELVFKEHTTSFILKTKERIAPDHELLLAVKPLAIETFYYTHLNKASLKSSFTSN